jgi:hypothetical protein
MRIYIAAAILIATAVSAGATWRRLTAWRPGHWSRDTTRYVAYSTRCSENDAGAAAIQSHVAARSARLERSGAQSAGAAASRAPPAYASTEHRTARPGAESSIGSGSDTAQCRTAATIRASIRAATRVRGSRPTARPGAPAHGQLRGLHGSLGQRHGHDETAVGRELPRHNPAEGRQRLWVRCAEFSSRARSPTCSGGAELLA